MVVYYEVLKPNKIVTSDRYRLQFIRLKRALVEKIREWEKKHNKIILQYNNVSLHSTTSVKNYVGGRNWEALHISQTLLRQTVTCSGE